MTHTRNDRVVLVYQVGLANVFSIGPDCGERKRLLQHAYGPCEWFVRGLQAGGARVVVAHADIAGDCAYAAWLPGPGDLFADAKSVPPDLDAPIVQWLQEAANKAQAKAVADARKGGAK